MYTVIFVVGILCSHTLDYTTTILMQIKPLYKKFPSINQYRHVVKNLIHYYRYDGNNEDGTVRYNNNPLPTVYFYGTVKAHGMNACIAQMEPEGDIFYQSKSRILTTGMDHGEFTAYMTAHDATIKKWFAGVRDELNLNYQRGLYIYGEWCGGNIQGDIALRGLPKMFIVFAAQITHGEDTVQWILPSGALWLTLFNPTLPSAYDINDFGTYTLPVNLEQPELSQNKIIDLVQEIEQECPIGKSFGKYGNGEGIVFYVPELGLDYAFKAIGQKYSSSRMHTIAAVDIERVTKLNELVDLVVTNNRLNQMLEGLVLERANVGQYLKKVFSDCIKEELDTIEGNGFTSKEFCCSAANKVKSFWFARC